jgi:hypothetical protein
LPRSLRFARNDTFGVKSGIAALVLLVVLASVPAPAAAEEGQAPGAQRFTVIVLGTRNAQDVDVIERNLRGLAYVRSLTPSAMSQRRVEYSGVCTGPQDTLIADVTSLAADRYELKARTDRQRGLVITLRKIQETAE